MNKVNLVIAHSQQSHNSCVMGDTEQAHMRPVAEALYDILKQDKRLNVFLIPWLDIGSDSSNLKASIQMSNQFIEANGSKGYHIELHSDAGNAKGLGAVGLYKSETGKRLAAALMEELSGITPAEDNDRIRQRTDLGALNQTIAYACIIEISFHDKPEEANWIHENAVSIAAAIAHGWFKFLKGDGLI